MKRQINFKFVAVLLAATLILGVGVHFLHAYQFRRNAAIFLDQADQAKEKGDSQQAAAFYGRYLGFVPGDVPTLANYGLALDEWGEKSKSRKTRARAYFILEQVLLRDPQRRDVRIRCTTLAMEVLGRFEEAKEHLKLLQKDPPQDADLEWRHSFGMDLPRIHGKRVGYQEEPIGHKTLGLDGGGGVGSQNQLPQARIAASHVIAQRLHRPLAKISAAYGRKSVHHLITRNDGVPAAVMKTA